MRANAIRLLMELAATLILGLALSQIAAAQDFPTRPVRFVVPYATSGAAICWPACSTANLPPCEGSKSLAARRRVA